MCETLSHHDSKSLTRVVHILQVNMNASVEHLYFKRITPLKTENLKEKTLGVI